MSGRGGGRGGGGTALGWNFNTEANHDVGLRLAEVWHVDCVHLRMEFAGRLACL